MCECPLVYAKTNEKSWVYLQVEDYLKNMIFSHVSRGVLMNVLILLHIAEKMELRTYITKAERLLVFEIS